MRLTIELTPGQGHQLFEVAETEGLDPATLAQKLLIAQLPEAPLASAVDGKRQAAIDMLRSWANEDATEDPNEIREAEEELAEFKRAMNANRAATGERPVFR